MSRFLCVLAIAATMLAGCGGNADAPALSAVQDVQRASTVRAAAATVNVLALAGPRSRYTLTTDGTAGTITVSDTTGAEPVRTFNGPSLRLVFSDLTVAFDVDGVPGQLYRLYKAAFNRAPDAGGLGFHLNAMEVVGLSKNQIARSFIDSPEFIDTYGALDDAQFVTRLYANVLGRAPDRGGLAFWVDGLKAQAVSRSVVLESFSESPENKAAVAASIALGVAYTPQPREPDPVVDLVGVTAPAMAQLRYRTASGSGITDAHGRFRYRSGEMITFSIGAIELASLPAAPVVAPLDVSDPVAGTNMLRLVKALDASYSLADGIVFPPVAQAEVAPVDYLNVAEVAAAVARIDPVAWLPPATDPEIATVLAAATVQGALGADYAGVYDSFHQLRSSSCTARPTDPKSLRFSFTQTPDWAASAVNGTLAVTLENGTTVSFATTGTDGTSAQGYAYTIIRGHALSKGRVIQIKLKAPVAGGCDVVSYFLRDKAKPNLPPFPSAGISKIMTSQTTRISSIVTYDQAHYGGPLWFMPGSKDVDGRVVLHEWSSSDGKKGTGTMFTVVVPRNEQVTVSLTATDDEGAQATKTWTLGSPPRTLAEVLGLLVGGYYVYTEGDYATYYQIDPTKTRVLEYECDVRRKACEETVYLIADVDTAAFLKGLLLSYGGLGFTYLDEDGGQAQFRHTDSLPPGYRIVSSGAPGGGGGGGSGAGGPGSGAGTGETTTVSGTVTGNRGSATMPLNDPGTPAAPETCVRRGAAPVMTAPPPACYRSSAQITRLSAFSWGESLDDLASGVYDDGDLITFNAKDLSAPYCVKDGTVNGLVMPWVCRIFYTLGG